MNRSSIRHVNILLLIVIGLQVSNLLFTWRPAYVRLILNEALFILLPTLLYLRWAKLPVRPTVGWRWPGRMTAVYQLLGLLVIIVAWSCWGFFYALSFIPIIANADQYQDAPPPIFWVGLGSMLIPFIAMGLWGLYGLYGGLRAWQGADFRYAVVGRLVAERLDR
ncbi:MAG: hypothetical protein R6X32_23145 [Chloroflexota bacterium]